MDRYIYMRTSLMDLVSKHDPDRVAIEYPIFNDLWSEGLYGLFLYSCEALLLSRMDVVFFANNQTKALGHRMLKRPKGWKMEKEDMREAAAKDTDTSKYRWPGDEADAYMAALLGGRFWGVFDGTLSEEDLTPYERRTFTAIHRPVKGRFVGKVIKRGLVYREDDRFFLWSKLGATADGEEEGGKREGGRNQIIGDEVEAESGDKEDTR